MGPVPVIIVGIAVIIEAIPAAGIVWGETGV